MMVTAQMVNLVLLNHPIEQQAILMFKMDFSLIVSAMTKVQAPPDRMTIPL